MNTPIMNVARMLRDLWNIERSPLPRALKIQIALSEARLRMLDLSRRLKSDHPVKVLDYTVKPSLPESFLYLFREIFIELSYYFRAKSSSPVILDCGSNIGMSVLFFKMLFPNSRIDAFEPEASTFERLQDNVETNKLSDVELHRAAVGRDKGTVQFFYDPNETGSLLASVDARRVPGGRAESVPQVRLSDFVTGPVDFLKLDVEGAELAVLEELRAAEALPKIDQMVVECHHHINRDEDSLSKILALLEDSGFGYQVQASWYQVLWRDRRGREPQDVVLYAYRK
jgi:FkbM family methyltransferase